MVVCNTSIFKQKMSLTGRKIMVTVLCMNIDAQKLHTLNQENTNPNRVFEATRGTLVPTK